MVQFKIISNPNQIESGPEWADATKFESRGRIVDANGKRVGKDFQGRRYRLVSKKQRELTGSEKNMRLFKAIFLIAVTLGVSLLCSCVRSLLSEKIKVERYGVLVSGPQAGEGNIEAWHQRKGIVTGSEPLVVDINQLGLELNESGRRERVWVQETNDRADIYSEQELNYTLNDVAELVIQAINEGIEENAQEAIVKVRRCVKLKGVNGIDINDLNVEAFCGWIDRVLDALVEKGHVYSWRVIDDGKNFEVRA